MEWQSVLDFFFPPQCGGCGEAGTGLCRRCLPEGQLHRRILPTLNVSGVGLYEENLRRAVLALKSGRRDVARAFAQRVSSLIDANATLVPVPTTAVRRRERGFDGCVLIAQLVARVQPVYVCNGLVQARGDAQRGRRRSARLAAHGRFSWRGEPLTGARVTLLDDVVTTGATLEDCATAIRAAGGFVSEAVAVAIVDDKFRG